MSANAGLEPIDQLDGFLAAAHVQRNTGALFYPYVAGVYNCLNSRTGKEAAKQAERRAVLDAGKQALLSNVMTNLAISGTVLTTYDFWNEPGYWEIVRRLLEGGIAERLPENLRERGITLRDFPREVAGEMGKSLGKSFDGLYSGSLYVPVEVAEALWLRKKYGVDWKIGPPSEELYDAFIEESGIGIIRTSQPSATEDGEVKIAMPYIGKPAQTERILFSDDMPSLQRKAFDGNPSFDYAFKLADAYEKLFGNGNISDGPTERIYNLIELAKSK
ncbi:MAG TPA: hypothetical protein VI979_00490 [archaeon]|nr:hypothetical protein [archaeon]